MTTDQTELERRVAQLETQVERLVSICGAIQAGFDFTYWLAEKKATAEQEQAIYVLMNRLEEALRKGGKVDALEFEASVEDALDLRRGEGHVHAASVINAFVQEGRYQSVTDALRASSWF